MVAYVAQRLLAIAFILFVMSLLIFGITQVMPGNVAYMIVGQFATPDVVAVIEKKLGLHDPIYVQYWRWASGVLRGDFGQSLIMERPVGPLIEEALARSAILAGLSFVCVAVLGIVLGVVAAVRKDTPTDNAISVFTYLGISVPEFFWGIVLILVFARYPQLAPLRRHRRSGVRPAGRSQVSDPASHHPDLRADRARVTPDALQHAGGHALQLRALCARQGAGREPGGAPPRAAQRAAADDSRCSPSMSAS